jgi:hypothetical protein
MVTIPGFLTRKDLYRISIIFKKIIHENVIEMKNKPDPALLRPSNLSNEIKKRASKSRETIPLICDEKVKRQPCKRIGQGV